MVKKVKKSKRTKVSSISIDWESNSFEVKIGKKKFDFKYGTRYDTYNGLLSLLYMAMKESE